MGINTDKIFEEFRLKGENLTDVGREKIIEDILYLQKLLTPIGIVKEPNDLLVLKDSSLIDVLYWQNELYAMKYFKQVSKEMWTEQIDNIYTKNK